MHNAPSVTYPVRPSGRAWLLLAVLWALGASSVAAWCFQADSLGARQVIGLVTLSVTACFVGLAGLRAPHGNLHWDGQYWSFDGADPVRTAQATVYLDFQSLLLLRLKVDRSIRWLWLDQATNPMQWCAVRRALFADATLVDAKLDDSAQPGGKQPATAAP